MLGKRWFYRLSVLPMLVVSCPAALADAQIGGVVQREFNGAVGTRTTLKVVEYLPFEHHVFAGERVETPYNGSTVLRFQDQTQLQLGADSSVELDRFVYDSDQQTVNGSIKLAKGIFRYISGSATHDEGLQLTTPTTTLTIRGTKFVVHVADDGSTSVGVLDGAVDVKPCGGGDTVHAKSGQGVKVGMDCLVSAAFANSLTDDPAVRDDYNVDGGGTTSGHGGDGHGTGGGLKGGGDGG